MGVHRRLHAGGLRMSTPNVRAFYASIGIELPARVTLNATVRCFAQPDAHQHGDSSPSCSVSLASGAWNCHGCGARGGAYDAARGAGHSPRSAMELLIAHGLAEPRTADHRPTDRQARHAPPARKANRAPAPAAIAPPRRRRGRHRVLGGGARGQRAPDPPARARARVGDPGDPPAADRLRRRPHHDPDPKRTRRSPRRAAATTRSGRVSRRCSPSRARASG